MAKRKRIRGGKLSDFKTVQSHTHATYTSSQPLAIDEN